MSAEADVVVVGAGVVGLATAAALARCGRSVIIAERNTAIAQETSTRNSEVIHAGIYYPADSLKATLCVAGRELLYARCAERAIPHRKTGKFIVATEASEIAALEALRARGSANGVPGLEIVGPEDVRRSEPDVHCEAALFSPETGIVDAHALAVSFLAEAESLGAMLALCVDVIAIERSPSGYRLRTRDASGTVSEIECAAVVNAAGLGSEAVAERAGFDVEARGYRLHLCKGDYFALAPSCKLRLSTLIYPVPSDVGLGIHITPDLAGRVRLGPDTEYVDAVRYEVDEGKRSAFARAVRRYLPALEDASLTPDFAGVRPKLAGPGESFRDFAIVEESDAGFPAFVNLIGIESPGLTASPAIAGRVVELLSGL
ncbi:MAG: NAD(P)/FAD-dependent oxidoreductase [Deltaproteobacteria bacterium]|nr:NAD(P)/FAD-dependent oxidoreductase [Deltaproteobacteria bacterium]